MISLSGLAEVAPGYADAEKKQADTQKVQADTQAKQTAQREAAVKLIGANVLGQALQGTQGPQAPPPGQASVPNRPPVPPAAIPPPPGQQAPQGGPPPPPASGPPLQPAAPVQTAPVAAGAPPMAGKLGLQPMIAQILKSSPGVANHPEVLLAALNHAKDLGILDPDAEAAVDDASKQHTLGRIAATKGHLQTLQGGASTAPAQATATPPPTATDPKTGAKVQWDGKAWQPLT
jgi:hypothetical protein